MPAHASSLILDLAKVLGVAALTTLLCRRLRQPVVLGYLFAGLILGPHVPVPLVAGLDNVQTLAELGVILVMFSVGLDFDLRKLARQGLAAVVLGLVLVGLTTWLGYLAGRAFGWTPAASALAGAALSVSSTMLVAKLFEEHGRRGRFRDLVLSVGLVQDLYAILLLAGLGAAPAAAGGLGWALAKVVLFLVLLLGAGGLVLPPALRWAADHGREETLLVVAVGACFTSVVLAVQAGCSPALGAFAAGMLAAGSRRVRSIERLVLPLRDVFAAVFFVAVGMLLDPSHLRAQAGVILAFLGVLLAAGCLGGFLGAAAAGLPLPRGVRVGLTLAQPGELSFVLVGMAGAAGGPGLPVLVGVSLLAAIVAPFGFRHGETLGRAAESQLPAGLRRRLEALRGWAEGSGRFPGGTPVSAPMAYLLLDALALNLVLLGAAQYRHHPLLHRAPVLGALAAALAVLCGSLYRRLGEIVDGLGGSRRRRWSLRAVLALAVLAPGFALAQPLLPRGPALALGAGVLVCLGILALVPGRRLAGSEWWLRNVELPWEAGAQDLPAPLPTARLEAGSPFEGRTLGDLDLALEAVSECVVVAVRRHTHWVGADPALRLRAGDLLAFSVTPPRLDGFRG